MLVFLCQPNVLRAEENNLNIRSIAIEPYGILSNGELSGIYFDLTEHVKNKMGWQSSHSILPYARIMHEIKAGKPIITIMYKYEQLIPYVDYIYALPTLKNVVIGKKSQNFENIVELNGKSLAYLRGAKFSEEIDSNNKIKKQVVTDFMQGLKMLEKGRVDGIIGPMQPILSAIQKLGYSIDDYNKPLIVSERTPWLQVTKGSLNTTEQLSLKEVFKSIMEEGTHEDIIAKYKSH